MHCGTRNNGDMTTAMESDWIPRDDLATRVVVLRTQMGLSRRQFAQLTGLTENQLQGIEDGRSPHKLPEKVQAIHDATGVSREWLMWGGPLNGEGPRPEGPGGGTVRHQGLEPRTRWYGETPSTQRLELVAA